MNAPPATLQSLAFDWGDAYLLSPVRDRWGALRRDARYFLIADSIAELETLIIADYSKCPVPREFDPPDAGDYLGFPGIVSLAADDGDGPDHDRGLDTGTLITVRELRRAFPAWTILYSTELGAWIAQTPKTTICEPSAALLCVALLLTERRHRHRANNPGPAG